MGRCSAVPCQRKGPFSDCFWNALGYGKSCLHGHLPSLRLRRLGLKSSSPQKLILNTRAPYARRAGTACSARRKRATSKTATMGGSLFIWTRWSSACSQGRGSSCFILSLSGQPCRWHGQQFFSTLMSNNLGPCLSANELSACAVEKHRLGPLHQHPCYNAPTPKAQTCRKTRLKQSCEYSPAHEWKATKLVFDL